MTTQANQTPAQTSTPLAPAPTPIRLADYQPPSHRVEQVELDVDIRDDGTRVRSRVRYVRGETGEANAPLTLQGDALETLEVRLDGALLPPHAYRLSPDSLTLENLPGRFELETLVRIQPDQNTQLSGFYRSRDGYFTQCEAQGFRRITWFLDRPDVMAPYRVTLHGDKSRFPILLANGNPVAAGDEDNGRHFATWEDPFKKPCYLFAMVAAKLDVLRDSAVTASGRTVQLAIFVEPGKLDQCHHAMAALKKAMAWDEETFGLECDLDHYMIVAVGDFNMGAMENKGLNIFNTKYVLARADTATDMDFVNIDRVVAHEYFHNWTGNRVTCREWFQLSLKEGLTVFRDQEFGADVHSRAVTRIQEVRQLRAVQFPEDAGPMAHPIRPDSYVEINNFYTATVYEKGAEVVRMIHTLIGAAAFRRGMDLYFARHDGQAVTCEDFVAAMADAAQVDLSRFFAWYRQAGTPRLIARDHYDGTTGRYTLSLSQTCPPTPGQGDKSPCLIPVRISLFGPAGEAYPLHLAGQNLGRETVLALENAEQTYVFEDLPAAPVPSLLRGFSAPVILDYPYDRNALTHLLAHDDDPFCRWEAGQRLFGSLILAAAQLPGGPETMVWPEEIREAVGRLLCETHADPALVAETLTLPGEATLAEEMDPVDPEALHAARNGLMRYLAQELEAEFLATYQRLAPLGPYQPDTAAIGRRRLRNLALAYLNELDRDTYRQLATRQFAGSDNMTDQFAALSVLANQGVSAGAEAGQEALDRFYIQWQKEALVVDKWLGVQATSRQDDALERVEALLDHPAFDLRNPNKVYALIRAFGGNHRHFHRADGAGYRFMAARILELDPINPQVASRLARCFDRWRKFDPARQAHARKVLTQIRDTQGLSRDVLEVVAKALD